MNQTVMFRYEWEWSSINWRTVETTVFKLQKRIYQASLQGKTVLVRKLQRLLTTSFAAKVLAVRKVTQQNKGKRTAGVDGITALTPAQRKELVLCMNLEANTSPIRRVWIDKPGKKEKRPLGIPTIRQRAIQTLVKMALEPQWEAKFEPNSYGFRPARSCHDAIQAIFNALKIKHAYVLDADIAGCFDNIDHHALPDKLNNSPKLKRLIKAWLKAGIMDNEIITPNKSGTSQGSTISPLLANIALHGMENDTKEYLREDLFRYNQQKWKGNAGKYMKSMSVVRYADDFVVIHEDKNIVLKARDYISEWLRKMGLELKAEKTRLCHTLWPHQKEKAGFTFLGFNIRQFKANDRKKGYKVIIRPDKESVRKHLSHIKVQLRQLRHVNQERVIAVLNPIIRGWVNYYQYVVSRTTFEKAEHVTFRKLWQWACYRHSRRHRKWIRSKYFIRHGGDNWRYKTKQGNYLMVHTDRKITRFVKVKENKSPFDGDFVYWTTRMGTYPEGSQKAAALVKKQKGRCGKCLLYFTVEDHVKVQHLNANEKDDRWINLLLVHDHCLTKERGMCVKH